MEEQGTRKGLRLDEVLQINNENLSFDLYFEVLYKYKEYFQFSNHALIGVKNPNFSQFEFYILKNETVSKDEFPDYIEKYYGLNIDTLYNKLNYSKFYFLVFVQKFSETNQRIIKINQCFLTIEHAKNRCKYLATNNNIVRIKNYYESHFN